MTKQNTNLYLWLYCKDTRQRSCGQKVLAGAVRIALRGPLWGQEPGFLPLPPTVACGLGQPAIALRRPLFQSLHCSGRLPTGLLMEQDVTT